MARRVSLINPYSKKENQITNYLGLILKYIYVADPDVFQKALETLLKNGRIKGYNGEELDLFPSFFQQQKSNDSVPDLTISQASFRVSFEVKLYDWFHKGQLEGHLDGMINIENKADVNILFLITDKYFEDIDDRINDLIDRFENESIYIQMITFEEYVKLLREIIDKYLDKDNIVFDMINEFYSHCINEGYISSIGPQIDIVSSGNTKKEIMAGFYSCPNKGGAYHHRRCRFFGAYWDKRVNYVADIKAVGYIDRDEEGKEVFKCLWNNSSEVESKLLEEAKSKLEYSQDSIRKNAILNEGWLIFLLDNLSAISYAKVSKGAIRSKIYREVESENIRDLVVELNGKIFE